MTGERAAVKVAHERPDSRCLIPGGPLGHRVQHHPEPQAAGRARTPTPRTGDLGEQLADDLGRFREGWDLAAQSDWASLRCRLWLLTMIPDPSWTSWMRLPREDPGSCICLYLLGALDPYTRLCAPALQPSVSSGSLQFLISLEPISQDLFILKVCPRLNLLWGAFPYAPPIPRVRLFGHWLPSEPCSGFFGNKIAIDCSCCGSWTLPCSYFFRFRVSEVEEHLCVVGVC